MTRAILLLALLMLGISMLLTGLHDIHDVRSPGKLCVKGTDVVMSVPTGGSNTPCVSRVAALTAR